MKNIAPKYCSQFPPKGQNPHNKRAMNERANQPKGWSLYFYRNDKICYEEFSLLKSLTVEKSHSCLLYIHYKIRTTRTHIFEKIVHSINNLII